MSLSNLISFAPRDHAPHLVDGDVTLRPHVLGDFDAFWDFARSARAADLDTPQSPTLLWFGMSSQIASWQLTGTGAWAIELNGTLAGQVALCQPPHFTDVELGWTLLDGFEGRSIAYRATVLARNWFWAETAHPSLVSYVDSHNKRSIALALRLGAHQDADAPVYKDNQLVFRHTRPAA